MLTKTDHTCLTRAGAATGHTEDRTLFLPAFFIYYISR